jgi:hypothetical protein
MPWGSVDLSAAQAEIDATALPPPLTSFDGPVTIEAFVVRHHRDGTPRSGTVLARNSGGARVLAAMDLQPDALAELERREIVGTRWHCRHDTPTGKNLAVPV